jgi:hypothetical protein
LSFALAAFVLLRARCSQNTREHCGEHSMVVVAVLLTQFSQ